jgi:hypothetical protein
MIKDISHHIEKLNSELRCVDEQIRGAGQI